MIKQAQVVVVVVDNQIENEMQVNAQVQGPEWTKNTEMRNVKWGRNEQWTQKRSLSVFSSLASGRKLGATD